MKYPNISDRVKAAIFDSLIIIFALFIVSDLLLRFSEVSGDIKLIIFILVFFLYDPIAVAFFGGTVGHHINKIKVVREDNHNKNIFILSAILRFAVKALLGWLSFLTINSSETKRAIHDIISGSVVVFKED